METTFKGQPFALSTDNVPEELSKAFQNFCTKYQEHFMTPGIGAGIVGIGMGINAAEADFEIGLVVFFFGSDHTYDLIPSEIDGIRIHKIITGEIAAL